VGAACAAVFLLARQAWPTGALPALLAVAVGTVITGGFHEDGPYSLEQTGSLD